MLAPVLCPSLTPCPHPHPSGAAQGSAQSGVICTSTSESPAGKAEILMINPCQWSLMVHIQMLPNQHQHPCLKNTSHHACITDAAPKSQVISQEQPRGVIRHAVKHEASMWKQEKQEPAGWQVGRKAPCEVWHFFLAAIQSLKIIPT